MIVRTEGKVKTEKRKQQEKRRSEPLGEHMTPELPALGIGGGEAAGSACEQQPPGPARGEHRAGGWSQAVAGKEAALWGAKNRRRACERAGAGPYLRPATFRVRER